MKLKFISVLVVVLIAFTSCKDDKKAAPETKNVKENFSVELDVIAEKSDDFTVYYTETGTNEFDGTKAAWRGVAGGNKLEKVVIDLPVEITPTNIRLDFGISPERKDVVLKNIKMIFYENSFEIKGSDFFNYFVKNDQIPTEVNAADGTIKFIKEASRKEGTYFYPRQELLDKIAKITKEVK